MDRPLRLVDLSFGAARHQLPPALLSRNLDRLTHSNRPRRARVTARVRVTLGSPSYYHQPSTRRPARGAPAYSTLIEPTGFRKRMQTCAALCGPLGTICLVARFRASSMKERLRSRPTPRGWGRFSTRAGSVAGAAGGGCAAGTVGRGRWTARHATI